MDKFTREQLSTIALMGHVIAEMDDRTLIEQKQPDAPEIRYLFSEHFDDSSSLLSLILEIDALRLEDEDSIDLLERYKAMKEKEEADEWTL